MLKLKPFDNRTTVGVAVSEQDLTHMLSVTWTNFYSGKGSTYQVKDTRQGYGLVFSDEWYLLSSVDQREMLEFLLEELTIKHNRLLVVAAGKV